MTKRILIDSSHPEEKRVAVVSGNNKLEEFEFEATNRQTLKGNIYLAKVTRVEPSLQAAFVDYGGNRHGFLAFSEIHPDYYQIPVSDKEALEKELAEAQKKRAEEIEDSLSGPESEPGPEYKSEAEPQKNSPSEDTEKAQFPKKKGRKSAASKKAEAGVEVVEISAPVDILSDEAIDIDPSDLELTADIQTFGGKDASSSLDDTEEVADQTRRLDITRRYKIQEVIKRNQIILVQIVKEERGNKGAALTTYMSLAGRYSVLMPNTMNAGGISRKINNSGDRKKLKKILAELNVAPKQSLIIRTAGQERTKLEIKRDYDYLSRTWDTIREKTLNSIAPDMVYEEGDLVKRSIRDLYTKDIEEILVEGKEDYKTAKSFMKALMPSHSKRVQEFRDESFSLFRKYKIEDQIESLQQSTVSLPSGGSIVINLTEALVAIDINSGRATKERDIGETALKTNLEAAVEIARQLRLRDLAGLIVIDFIDMDTNSHAVAVERKLREAMKLDRARIQTGRISQFGLLELSRQRLRPSIFETLTQMCATCGGTGHVRSIESTALAILRSIEEEGVKARAREIDVIVPGQVALYLFNKKRPDIAAMEKRFGIEIRLQQDSTLSADDFKLRMLRSRKSQSQENSKGSSRTKKQLSAVDSEGTKAPEDSKENAENTEKTDKNKRRRRNRKRNRAERPVTHNNDGPPGVGETKAQQASPQGGHRKATSTTAGASTAAVASTASDSAGGGSVEAASGEKTKKPRRRRSSRKKGEGVPQDGPQKQTKEGQRISSGDGKGASIGETPSGTKSAAGPVPGSETASGKENAPALANSSSRSPASGPGSTPASASDSVPKPEKPKKGWWDKLIN